MNKFLAKNKVNLEKMFLVIFLYIYMITFLAYILTDHFYSYGFNIGVLYSALLFAFAWWICGFRRNFLIAYLGMMFFLCSGILIKLFDHIIVMALDIFVNISLASIIWISILLIGFCINNIAAILGKCSVGRVIAGLWIIFSLIPFALSNLLFWIYYIVSHHYLRSDTILAVYQTNLKEAIDYLLTQNIFSLLFAFLGSLLILIFIGYVVRIICISMRKRIEFASRRYLWGSLILTIFLLFLGVKVTYSFVGYEPVRIMDSLKNSVKRYTSFAKNRQERMQYLYNLGTLSVLPEHKGIYVLVIGESTARDHMSVYGYRFDTTPWMSQFVKEPGTICFKKAYSNYVTTVPVLTYALTDKNQYNSVSMAQAYSLIEVAAAAGFDTYWISNQERYGIFDTPIAEIASMANHQIWLNGDVGEYIRSNYYDEELADQTPDLKNADNALIVYHLMGCHQLYTERYPFEYQKFDRKVSKTSEYDNAILYTDYVVSRLYDLVKDNPNFQGFIYFSDHGEESDDGTAHEPTKFSNQMTRIPLIAHFSERYRENHSYLFSSLIDQRSSYWTNDLLYNFMVEIMGIQGAPMEESNLTLGNIAYDRTKDNSLTMHGERKIES